LASIRGFKNAEARLEEGPRKLLASLWIEGHWKAWSNGRRICRPGLVVVA
jgi:hypothetical protein